MNRHFRLGLIPAAVLALAAAVPAVAQDTTSAIRGRILDGDGNPVSGAQIVVFDTRTGRSTTLSTTETGSYSASGLRVGGPYEVRVTAPGGDTSRDDVYLSLGDSYALDMTLGDDAVQLEQVTIVGAALRMPETAIGPSAAYNVEALATAPSLSRDLKDVIRADPRIYIDTSFNDSIQCAGASPRFNSITVDGVKFNDNFGLNSNGYPTERMPFPFDAIDQVAVELAPFDVQYGGFSACNINAVTKSGTNEFHGSLFFDYTDDSLTGDKLEGDKLSIDPFDQKRYGGVLSGPIIKDKLFFMAAYEKLEGVDTFDRGPVGSGRAAEVQGVSQSMLDEIVAISNDLYGYDPGDLPTSLPVEDEKVLVKLDWYITDTQRAAFTYNYNDGFHIAEADSGSDELELSNHYYERGAKVNSYVAQLFSDWTDAFSTELKVGYSELKNRQLSLGGTEFGEVQINTYNPETDSTAVVYLGADDSRHANKLSYDTLNLKLAGTYLAGNHVITGGYEREAFDVFNLFIQEAEGEYRFGSIEDWAAGTPYRITYENAAFTNNPDDAAAKFKYETNSVYLQDEYRFANAPLTITAGLRYDWYTSGDRPTENTAIMEAYGFSNTSNVDGLDLLQPRFGFNWEANENLDIHGGVGLYSGGNPNVWISNNYSNNGVTQIENQDRSGTSVFDMAFTGEGRPIYDIPQDLYDLVAEGIGGAGGVNLMDPDFKIPTAWKYNLGAVFYAPRDYTISFDYLYSDNKDAAIIQDISLVKVDETPDGRPIYESNGRNQDFMLTNADGDSGYQSVASLSIQKSYDFGLSWTFGYAATSAKDISSMTSSVAYSNYVNNAVSDSNNPGVATSNYEIPNRFTLNVEYKHAFFGDYDTTFSVYSQYNQGRPYSYVFDNFDSSVGDTTFGDHQLLYMPTGPEGDPNVDFAEGFQTNEFFAWAEENGLMKYAGQTVPRNAFNSKWWLKMDVKLEQEFPGFFDGAKFKGFVVVKNFTNLLNDDWGVLKQPSFPQYFRTVDASINDLGQYQFNSFNEPTTQSRVSEASLYQILVGVRYEF